MGSTCYIVAAFVTIIFLLVLIPVLKLVDKLEEDARRRIVKGEEE